MKKKLMIFIPALTLLALLLVFVGTLGLYARNGYTYSAFEARSLAQTPVYSHDALMDGSYLQGWETFLSDQFIGRNYLLKSYNLLQLKLLGKNTVGDLVLSDRGAILPRQDVTAEDPTEEVQAVIHDHLALQAVVEENGGQLLYAGLPGQGSILRDFYPEHAFNKDDVLDRLHHTFFTDGTNAGLSMIDLLPVFEAAEGETHLYYRTDHHYTLEGAFTAYAAICEKLDAMGIGFHKTGKEDYIWQTLPNPFVGSRGRQLFGVVDYGEKLQIAHPKEPIDFVRTDNGVLVESSVYTLPTNETDSVDYNLYMGGDKAETILQTNRSELPNCLLVGDSYTNALECFLYTGFNETRSLDLRHYDEMSLQDYIRQYQPDIVIILRDDGQFLNNDGNGNVN